MGLFDKKYCDFCGEKIGMLGNRKLEDGNMCKNCASKLSPFFSDRKHSTVAEIREQLDYREANKDYVANFKTTRTLGNVTKVLLDESAGLFMVTSARNITEANPDVMKFTDVTGCVVDVTCHRDEEKRTVKDSDGRTHYESYNPPRYKFGYDFQVRISVNNPYFDTISFQLNRSRITINNGAGFQEPSLAMLKGNQEYAECDRMGQQIVDALTKIQEQVREERNTPRVAVTCPWCGATTMPDAKGCCEYCGGALS